MSRWLINYTPQATLVRLCTLACVSSYATSWVVHLAGADRDPGLLLPAWISIASILTACYQVTQRRVNIRKETRLSVSVFSYASFISMVALLVHSHYAYYVASLPYIPTTLAPTPLPRALALPPLLMPYPSPHASPTPISPSSPSLSALPRSPFRSSLGCWALPESSTSYRAGRGG